MRVSGERQRELTTGTALVVTVKRPMVTESPTARLERNFMMK